MNLYFLTQGILLLRKNNQLAVYKENEKISSYPLSTFNNIFLFGNINIKHSLISYLLSNQKYIIFLSSTGFFKGILIPSKAQSNINPRINQYSKYFNPDENLSFSKKLVLEKINEIEESFNLDLSSSKKSLEKAKNLNSILGIEGTASAKMFEKFRCLLKKQGLKFEKRTYNPPKDKINSILSSFYTIFYNCLIPEVLYFGLDPYLGFLHKKKGTHHAFVSDLMEILRPSITFYVYKFLSENNIENINFNETNKGVYLSNEEIRKVLNYIHNGFYDNSIKKVKKFIREDFFK